MTIRKSTWLLAALLAAACGGSGYKVSRTGGSPAGGSGGVGGAGGGTSGNTRGGTGGNATGTGSTANSTGGTGGTGGGAAGATPTGGRTGSGGAGGTLSTGGNLVFGGAGGAALDAAISTGGSVTSGGAGGTAVGGAATGGASGARTGGASASGGVTGNGGVTGGTSTTGTSTGGVSGSGGTSAVLVPCSLSDGSGCDDATFCVDTRGATCTPTEPNGCKGYCGGRRRTPFCAGMALSTPCPDGFTCLPDTRTTVGTETVSVCVGSDTPECTANGDCPTGFLCVPSASGSRCSPDKTVCNAIVTCRMALPPQCPPGYTRSTPDGCFGPCVPVEQCGCSTSWDCSTAGAICDLKQGRCYIPKAPEPRCLLPFDSGSCDAAVRPVYAFLDGECKSASYGGCGGNDNRFSTLEECRSRCEGLPGDKPCPDGTGERVICLQCGAGGGCIRYVDACAKTCATQADCKPSGLICDDGYCQVGGCV